MSLQKTIDMIYLSLNRARTQPSSQAKYYQNSKQLYNGLIYRQNIKTRQGVNALQNLIQQLNNRHAIPNKLKWSFALHMAADQQAIKLGDNNITTTEGTCHHTPLPERCKQYGIIRGRLSEVYQFGGNSPEEILESLLIDDGLASRKRRKTLLDPIYNYVGIGTSFHQKYGTVTVIILAEDVISLVSPGDQGSYIKRQTLPQGQKFVFDVLSEVMNEKRRLQQESFRGSSYNSKRDQSFNDSFSAYPSQNIQTQNKNSQVFQNVLLNTNKNRNEEASCQIF